MWMGKSWKNPLKEAVAQKRGQVFTKLVREISVSVRMGGADPQGNPRLKVAIQAARAASCPKETIERAIKRGRGLLGEESIEELTYEGYGPYQVGVLVVCQTTNKNRCVSEMRMIFKKNEGKLEALGSVAWMFERVCWIEGTKLEVTDPEEEAIEVGAEDVKKVDGAYHFYGAVEDLDAMRNALAERGWEITVAELSYRPKSFTELEDEQRVKVHRFLEALEESEDSHRVYATIDSSW